MRTLRIDIETYSSVDLLKCGVYPYVEAPDFEILLFAYAWDDEPVQLVDLTDLEELPEDVWDALTDHKVIKTAFNANFERVCIAKHYGIETDPSQWRCTAVQSLMLGLPTYLEGVAQCLKLEQQKDAAGKNLIKFFSVPCKPTKKNGGRTRNHSYHNPEKWEEYKAYCIQDVETERAISKALDGYDILPFEQRLWELDQRIADRGIAVDMDLVQKAIQADQEYKERLTAEAAELTGLDNPNSVAQLKAWFLEHEGVTIDSLSKDALPKIKEELQTDEGLEMLRLRKELSKTSVRKYEAMQRGHCQDHRLRGLLQFYGANRTGRWAGRLVQVHNLPKNKIADLKLARDLLREGDFELLEMLYGSVSGVLSQLIRTAFIPSPDSRFIVSDFSAIEARVIAWLSGEQWRLDVFNTHGKIYEASASAMFGIPIDQIDKGSDLRQRGKVAELALGYQGGPGALIQMGALDMGIPEDDLQGLVDAWRNANPKIKQFWYKVGNAAVDAVDQKRVIELHHGLRFIPDDPFLFIELPSKRRLAYYKPKLKPNKWGGTQLSYEGVDQDTKRWGRLSTYGGKLVENIVQAVARDCLAVSLLRLDERGYDVVMHVHDEVVLDEPKDWDCMQEITDIMGQPIAWAPGLPLAADAFETEFYMKD
ncbi:DNA polymerase [Paenibacillus senegalensis]|uniref:DNA polymerase n=1 Tax=Paenibacillus senegalensis TaxID=1465766 RepID=UPI000289C0C4|nr:DNA polymerase [Paenibacillus senegalensis]